MSLTHRKLLFARAYAKNPDRREAVIAAGYSPRAAERTASRLLTDPEVLSAIEKEQNKLLKREEVKKMTRADVVAALGEMYAAASDKPGRSGWSARLKVLEVMARVLPADADPKAAPQPVSDAELRARIRELEAQLEPEPIHESTKKEVVAKTLSEVLADQPPAPERQQSPNAEPSAGAPKAQPPIINNFTPTSPDEKVETCMHGHGEYVAQKERDLDVLPCVHKDRGRP